MTNKEKSKKDFKLEVLGLFKWESKQWTVTEVAIILLMTMIFIIIVIAVLKA